MRFFDYLYPKDFSWEDKPAVIVNSVSGSLSVGNTSTIVIDGFNFDLDTVAVIYTADSEANQNPVIDGIYQSPRKLIVNYTAQVEGTHYLIISNGYSNSETFTLKSLSPVNETTVEEQILQGIITFAYPNDLTISNQTATEGEPPDIYYYKDVKPQFKNNGVYTTSKGYLAFPKLAWNIEEETKSVSFIFYGSTDSRYMVFGLAGDRYNWNSNDYNKIDLGIRIRGSRGLYGLFGLSQSDRNTYTANVYSPLDANAFYRLEIPDNAAKESDLKIFQLASGNPQDWFGGSLVFKHPLPLMPSRKGKIFTPGIWDYSGSQNSILAVIVN